MAKRYNVKEILECRKCKFFTRADGDGYGICIGWGYDTSRHVTSSKRRACKYFEKRTIKKRNDDEGI